MHAQLIRVFVIVALFSASRLSCAEQTDMSGLPMRDIIAEAELKSESFRQYGLLEHIGEGLSVMIGGSSVQTGNVLTINRIENITLSGGLVASKMKVPVLGLDQARTFEVGMRSYEIQDRRVACEAQLIVRLVDGKKSILAVIPFEFTCEKSTDLPDRYTLKHVDADKILVVSRE